MIKEEVANKGWFGEFISTQVITVTGAETDKAMFFSDGRSKRDQARSRVHGKHGPSRHR